ncbi:MAG: ribosomal protein S18-alanine N-acetyltransferase [Lachnospiraceae bacterium]|nr:ribosomal protein S18-alanine N-acetyltransferase [Lachnospiraceae bacterium]
MINKINLDDLVIREMQAEDVDAVTDLEQSCFSMPWKRADFEDIVTRSDRIYLVAVYRGELAGGCMMSDIVGEGDISNVAVYEQYRGQRIADMLLKAMFSLGEERSIVDYTLEVRSQNQSAIRLYERNGFVTEGVRKNFYQKPTDDALIMWKRS